MAEVLWVGFPCSRDCFLKFSVGERELGGPSFYQCLGRLGWICHTGHCSTTTVQDCCPATRSLCQVCRRYARGHRCRGHIDQWPSRSDSHWPIRRATISNPPPGGHRQSNAPAASDRFVRSGWATRRAARQRRRRDAENFGGEVSWRPPDVPLGRVSCRRACHEPPLQAPPACEKSPGTRKRPPSLGKLSQQSL